MSQKQAESRGVQAGDLISIDATAATLDKEGDRMAQLRAFTEGSVGNTSQRTPVRLMAPCKMSGNVIQMNAATTSTATIHR